MTTKVNGQSKVHAPLYFELKKFTWKIWGLLFAFLFPFVVEPPSWEIRWNQNSGVISDYSWLRLFRPGYFRFTSGLFPNLNSDELLVSKLLGNVSWIRPFLLYKNNVCIRVHRGRKRRPRIVPVHRALVSILTQAREKSKVKSMNPRRRANLVLKQTNTVRPGIHGHILDDKPSQSRKTVKPFCFGGSFSSHFPPYFPMLRWSIRFNYSHSKLNIQSAWA